MDCSESGDEFRAHRGSERSALSGLEQRHGGSARCQKRPQALGIQNAESLPRRRCDRQWSNLHEQWRTYFLGGRTAAVQALPLLFYSRWQVAAGKVADLNLQRAGSHQGKEQESMTSKMNRRELLRS